MFFFENFLLNCYVKLTTGNKDKPFNIAPTKFQGKSLFTDVKTALAECWASYIHQIAKAKNRKQKKQKIGLDRLISPHLYMKRFKIL